MSPLYSDMLNNHLKNSPFMRHLFNKIGKPVLVKLLDGVELRGILISVDVIWRGLEILDPKTGKVWYVHWRHCYYVETEEVEK